jgi:hypothetical protein
VGRGDWGVDSPNITLPPGAGPGDPRLVIGPILPPPLDTYLFFGTDKATTAIIWYGGTSSDDDYSFLAQVPTLSAHFIYVGHVLNGAVVESSVGRPGGQWWMFNGSGISFLQFLLNSSTAGPLDYSLWLPELSLSLAQPRGYRDAMITDNGIVVTGLAGGAEVAVPSANWDQEINWILRTGRVYKATVRGNFIESSGAGGVVSFMRLRKGSATVVGTQLGFHEQFHQAATGGFTESFERSFVFANRSGATVTTKLSLTIQSVVGVGNVQLHGDANIPLEVWLEDIGATVEQTASAQHPTV